MDLTRAQVEYTLISMRHRAIQTSLPFNLRTDEESDQEFHPSEEAQQTTTRDIHDPTIFSGELFRCS